MFARLARYSVPPERVDEAVDSFGIAAQDLEGLDGFVHGYLLVDPDEGTATTLTLWTDRRALEESSTRAAAMRLRAVQAVDGTCESVQEYEVPLEFGTAADLGE